VTSAFRVILRRVTVIHTIASTHPKVSSGVRPFNLTFKIEAPDPSKASVSESNPFHPLLVRHPTNRSYKNQITMPHSSYQRTFHPPIASLDRYRVKLFKLRISSQDGNREDPVEVLVLGETLLEHCEFLDTKLGMTVRISLACRNVHTPSFCSSTRHWTRKERLLRRKSRP